MYLKINNQRSGYIMYECPHLFKQYNTILLEQYIGNPFSSDTSRFSLQTPNLGDP